MTRSVLLASIVLFSTVDAYACAHLSGNRDRMRNSCGWRISVAWTDQGYCSSINSSTGYGCGTEVPAYGQTLITKTQGRVQWASCRYPQTPFRTGGNSYECR